MIIAAGEDGEKWMFLRAEGNERASAPKGGINNSSKAYSFCVLVFLISYGISQMRKQGFERLVYLY